MSDARGPKSGLVTVLEAASEFEAQTVAAVLAEAGIEAHVFPLATIPIPDPLRARPSGGMPVQVAAGDLERARAAIEAARESASRLDWDTVELGDPPPEVASIAGRTRRPRGRRLVGVSLLAVAVIVALAILASSFPWR